MAKKKSNKDEEKDDLHEEQAGDINEADDSFGLPEVSYDPIDRDKEEEPEEVEETPAVAGYDDSEGSEEESEEAENSDYIPGSYVVKEEPSKAPLIITLVAIGLILIIAGGYWFGYRPYQANQVKYTELIKEGKDRMAENNHQAAIGAWEKALKIKPKSDEAPKLIASAKEAIARAEAEAKKKKEEADRLAAAEAAKEAEEEAKPEVGTIKTLSARTGRYHVIVGSSIDGDLAMDYANKMVKKGVNINIIQPFGGKKFHRIAMGNYDTFADAQKVADQLKPEYGESLWVLKY